MKRITHFFLLICAILLAQCAKEPAPTTNNQPDPAVLAEELAQAEAWVDMTPYTYPMDLPKHIKDLGLKVFPVSNSRAMLGRILFYDKNLSEDRSVSCASCHDQNLGFADNKRFSDGINGAKTDRNSIALGMFVSFSNAYDGSNNSLSLFWDGRAKSIAAQCRETMASDKEMGLQMEEVVARVKEQPYYPYFFRQVNGDAEINEMRVLSALMDFVNSISSIHTPFDEGANQVLPNEMVYRDFPGFSAAENAGKKLYMTHCSNCHGVNMSVAPRTMACNGLDEHYSDPGLGRITGFSDNIGMFKVPTLRNIARTAPYMHDGRFATLEAVVEHYSTGIKASPALDLELRNTQTGEAKNLHLSVEEKANLVAFLGTLTDKQMQTEARWSNPFK